MTVTTYPFTLETFLQSPETEPATEFINGATVQKPMPQGEHSLIQGTLCEAINQVAKAEKIALAFPELRCTFGGGSIVPDIAAFRWDRIPRTAEGRIGNRFETHPDWAIEILSPDQSLIKVLGKLMHCIENGTELCWLIDPTEDTILAVFENQRVQLFQGASVLPVLNGIQLSLTVEQVFSWLLV
jgi:Uma2 family endonuclease